MTNVTNVRKPLKDDLNFKEMAGKIECVLINRGLETNLDDNYNPAMDYWSNAKGMIQTYFDEMLADLLTYEWSWSDDKYHDNIDYVEEMVAGLIARELDFDKISKTVAVELEERKAFNDNPYSSRGLRKSDFY